MNPNEQANQPPQKLLDFNEELKALCAKYQYELRPVMQFDQLRGIFMTLQAFDISPKDEGVSLNTEEAQTIDEAQEDAKKNDSQDTLETSQNENSETPVDNTVEN